MKNTNLNKKDLFMKIPKNLPLLLKERTKELGDATLQISKDKDGNYVHYSYKTVYQNVLRLSYALKKIGIKKDELVGFISDNRREWMILDYALLSLGASDVPRGCDSQSKEIEFILNYTSAKFSIFENQKQLEKILNLEVFPPSLKTAILIENPEENFSKVAKEKGITLFTYSELEKIGKEASESDLLFIENELDKIEGDTLATIIFTSGTTGDPKGVMLTHDNYVAHCEAVKAALPVTQDGDIWLSVLPVWHSFERVFTYFVPALKSSIAYSKPIANIMLSDMKNVQPTWLCGVPRLWESLAKGIFRKMKNEKPVKRFFFNAGVKVGTVFSWANDRVNGLVCRYTRRPRIFDFMIGIVPFVLLYPLNAFFRKVVFSKLHNLFGGKMWGAVSGGGALQKDVDIFYRAIGFTLLEGYGITEAGPVLSVRNPTCPRYGCVGEVFPAATVRIVNIEEDGSAGTKVLPHGEKGIIQAKGRQIMKGYYKREDLTRFAITEDGYLNTGDIGMLTFDGEIKITGRAKDTIVLLAGENIEPATIEKALMNSPYIERAMIVGQDEKYIGALIVPEKESTMEMANNLHIIYNSWEDLLLTKEMNNFFQRELDKRVCAKTGFRLCERIGKFVLLPNQFETGKEVNAKGEMMRHRIIKLYEKEIKQLFV